MKIYDFPALPIMRQLFHVPGAAYDGGLTSGGAQFITPEPGGISVLEIEPDTDITQWDSPTAAWLMSKINGQIFRVRLSRSPQVSWSRKRLDRLDYDWSSPGMSVDANATASFASSAAKGSTVVTVNLSAFGKILQPGHVIGHEFDCYQVDEVSYSGNVATVTVTPPFRRAISAGSDCLLTPWFTGRIANGAEIRSAYDWLGHVKMPNIIFNEAIV